MMLALALMPAAAVSQTVADASRAALAAEQAGDGKAALAAADRLDGSREYARMALALQVRSQFLSPAAFLALREPTSDQLLLHQIWRALRIEAMARAGQVGEARAELMLMRKEAMRDKFLGNEPPELRIAEHVAVARINFAMKNYRGAATRFERAAEIQSKSGAPVWHQPLDSALGAALLKAGDAQAASAAFGRALARQPDNVWALWGRAKAQAATGNAAGSAAKLAEIDKLWKGDKALLTLDRL